MSVLVCYLVVVSSVLTFSVVFSCFFFGKFLSFTESKCKCEFKFEFVFVVFLLFG
jgi:hypothetical protein